MNKALVLVCLRCCVLLGICAQTALATSPASPIAGNTPVADLYVVDCLLPGQVRRLGQARYITARRPIMTTAADCRLRGGEYTEYDRANYRSALSVWMAAAQAGDPEAQTNVGEIFERGLGDAPNHEAALLWYERAAAQGFARAQFNLGTLYERGLGVPANKLIALNWYRKAWGMPENALIYQAAAQRAYDAQRQQLKEALDTRNSHIALLKSQVKRLQDALASAQADAQQNDVEAVSLRQQLAQLRDMIAGLNAEQGKAQTAYNALPPRPDQSQVNTDLHRLNPADQHQQGLQLGQNSPTLREPPAQNLTSTAQQNDSVARSESAQARDRFGRYYALIIGNSRYQHLDDLQTPQQDAQRLAQVLSEQYGFSTHVLNDSSDVSIMTALNDLATTLDASDNLLIYYAGHGSRLAGGAQPMGYWLPVNADPPPRDTHWIANEAITRHLGRLSAKRILVVADSCYSGLLANSPDYLFLPNDANLATPGFLTYKLSKGSRLILASGGDSPVLDRGGNGHSVFAQAFIDILMANTQVLTGPQLFAQLRPRVEQASAEVGFLQVPTFNTIKVPGNEAGDFFFVPR